MPRTLPLLCLVAALTAPVAAAPIPNDALRDAAQKAIANNPEVTARFNAFRAAGEDVAIASAAFYPRVDLSAEVAATRDRITTRIPPDGTLKQAGAALSVSQLLWDGWSTRSEVQRLDHARLARYHEFLDTSEQTALEAVRAYVDVLRFRALLQLADDDYVQHKYAYEQILSRVKAGVARGVDLEQAGARLALAESNRVTEIANLHDVSERYRRLVGEAPPERMPVPIGLDAGLPTELALVIAAATQRTPAVAAAIENLRAAQQQASVRQSAFQPRVEARVRVGGGHNFDGVQDQKRDSTAGVFLNWNLFSGGADQARVRQAVNLIDQAGDLRDKACRDARQTATIAFNDIRKLASQLVFLDRNVLAIEKARDAYRQQFDIGQRSLLDLLNAENELFTARRAYANAEHDLLLARGRAQAGVGQLIGVLGLTRAGRPEERPDLQDWSAGAEAPARCPASISALTAASREELDARARQLLTPTPQTPAQGPVQGPARPAR